jgi:hypothetical protein
MVSDFLCNSLQTDCTVLKLTALTTTVYLSKQKNNLHITGGEKKGVPVIILHNFRVSQ